MLIKALMFGIFLLNHAESAEDENLNPSLIKKQNKPAKTTIQHTVDSLLHGMEVVDLKRSVVLPDWLRNEDAIPVEEKRDSRDLTMRELSKNVNHEFGVEEKKTVDRFIEALRIIADEETKETKREIEAKKKSVSARKQCKDVRNDCATFQEYCTTHKKKMKKKCAKTCKYCLDCDHNEASEEHCLKIKSIGLCNRREATKYCAKTCDTCGENGLAICENSIYGCCWDRKTAKEDERGSNCPACKEKFKTVCQMFNKDCVKNTGAGQWMRKYCQVTCGICKKKQKSHYGGGECQDDPKQSEFCGVWKNAGWCHEKMDLMHSYCARTCYSCRNMK